MSYKSHDGSGKQFFIQWLLSPKQWDTGIYGRINAFSPRNAITKFICHNYGRDQGRISLSEQSIIVTGDGTIQHATYHTFYYSSVVTVRQSCIVMR